MRREQEPAFPDVCVQECSPKLCQGGDLCFYSDFLCLVHHYLIFSVSPSPFILSFSHPALLHDLPCDASITLLIKDAHRRCSDWSVLHVRALKVNYRKSELRHLKQGNSFKTKVKNPIQTQLPFSDSTRAWHTIT